MVRMGSGRLTRASKTRRRQSQGASWRYWSLGVCILLSVFRAPDRNLVLSALRACSARSTTVKCSTLLYLNGGPVLTCPPLQDDAAFSGRPQTTDLAICFVQIFSRNVCVCYSARRWPPVRRSIDKESAR